METAKPRARGCGIFWWWEKRKHRRAIVKFFKDVDSEVLDNLKDGSIKLLRADYFAASPSRIGRRQDLEQEEQKKGTKIFHSTRAAAKIFSESRRKVGVLTYGWNTPEDPDPTGTYMAAVCSFLNSELGAHVEAVFWDVASLPQKPRTGKEEIMFSDALNCMGGLYASGLGTMVMRHRGIPARPRELDGVVVLRTPPPQTCCQAPHWAHSSAHGALPPLPLNRVKDASESACNLCGGVAGPFYKCSHDNCDFEACYACAAPHQPDTTAEDDRKVRSAFHARGDTSVLVQQDGEHRWRATFRSHALAQSAVEWMNTDEALAAAGLSGAYCHCLFNSRPYFHDDESGEAGRGWTTFESGVAAELLFRVQFCSPVVQFLTGLPPKIVEIDHPQCVPLCFHPPQPSPFSSLRVCASRKDEDAIRFSRLRTAAPSLPRWTFPWGCWSTALPCERPSRVLNSRARATEAP